MRALGSCRRRISRYDASFTAGAAGEICNAVRIRGFTRRVGWRVAARQRGLGSALPRDSQFGLFFARAAARTESGRRDPMDHNPHGFLRGLQALFAFQHT